MCWCSGCCTCCCVTSSVASSASAAVPVDVVAVDTVSLEDSAMGTIGWTMIRWEVLY